MSKLRVYTQEPNIVYGNTHYLPYSTGLLRAYALTDPAIRDGIEFQPFIHSIEPAETILAKYDAPDIACFSTSMWNERLNLRVAEEVKTRWPNCVVIFGGCQVPHYPKEYMSRHWFIDFCVRGDGEDAFKAILARMPHAPLPYHYSDIPAVTYRAASGEICENKEKWPFDKDLDRYPSPYATGLFDQLVQEGKEGKSGWQAIFETNRGCPF